MNALCYKTVFSKRLGALVAVGEHAASQGKGQGAGDASGAASGAWTLGSVLRYVGVLALGFASVSLAWSQTLPQGGRVSQGQVTISQSGQQMAITQSTAKAVVNWDSFDIGANAKVNIAQPSSQSVLLNRVLSDNPTQILGQLQANGQVVLVNPKGIVVGSDGSVSASAFTASTLNISDADFMAGNGRYSREGSTGEVVNKGRISVAPGGYVALLGARVSNEGQIIAPQGAVALGAAETVTVPIGRTGKIKLELSPASINASVANQKGGVIIAEGGQVYMQAAALGQAVASVLHSGHIDTSGAQAGAVHLLADGGQIKVDGSITANSSGQDDQGQLRKGGDIFIGRDEETGVLARATDVSGAKLESQRGFVETSGDHLVTTGTRVKAAEWLLDPSNITIAASGASGTAYAATYTAGADSVILASDINASLNAGTSVTIATGAGGASAGDINVNANIAKTGGSFASLTLRAHNDIVVAANTTITSTSGNLNVTLNSDFDANSAGAIVMNTGSGITSNGGNITLGGGSAGNGTGYSYGYNASTRYTGVAITGGTLSATGGNISIKGRGNTTYANVSNMRGVDLSGAVLSTSGSGNIQIDGIGGNANISNTNVGVGLTNGTTITGSSGGTVSLTGTGGNGANYNFGVWLSGSTVKITSPGAISLNGTGGGSAAFGTNSGVMIQQSATVEGTGSGSVTVVGAGASSTGNDNHGVEITGSGSVKSQTGSIQITGSRVANSATGSGIYLGSSGSVASSGNAAVTLTTDSLGMESTSTLSAGSGTVTVQNRTAGTLLDVGGTSADVTTATLKLGISSAELARITAGTLVVGRRDATATGNVVINALNMGATGNTSGSLSVLSGGNIGVNGAVTKTAGTDATLSLLANGNINVASSTITGSSGKLNVLLNSDSDASGAGSIVFNIGSGVTSNGGNITLGGGSALDGSGTAVGESVSSYAGITLATAAFNAGGGNIAMTGTTFSNAPNNSQNVHGIVVTGGAINTTGAGTIALKGYSKTITDTLSKGIQTSGVTITGGSTGTVSLIGDSRSATAVGSYLYGVSLGTNTVVTSLGGNIEVTGYGGNGSGTFAANIGVNLSSAKVTGVGAGTVTISGTGGQGAAGSNMGVWTTGASTAISSQGTDINIIGQGGNGANSEGIFIGGGTVGVASGTTSANVILTSDSTKIGAAINSGTGTTTIQNKTAGTLINVGGADVLNTSPLTLGVTNAEMNLITAGTLKIGSTTSGAMTTSTAVTTAAARGNIYLQSGSTLSASHAIASGAGLYLQTTGGALSNSAALSGTNVSLDNSNGSINLATGAITSGAGITAAADGITVSGALTATTNLNVYGASGSANGVNTSANWSGKYINAIGTTSTGFTGFSWNGGTINTTGTGGTSTASTIKGISAASTTASNGYGAFMMFNNGTTNAASGTTLTFAGEATTLSTGQNTKERGILVQGGRTLTMSGDVTLEGSSKSSDGISFGGTINMATVAGVTNKLTLKGTTAASSNSALNGVNFSGTITGNAATSSINIIGEAKNLSGTNYDNAVNTTGTITGSSANVNIQGLYGKVSIDGAITGANISVDNTGGTIDATTGAITAGAGTSLYTNAVNISKALTATGNVNVLGRVATTTHTGANLTATAPITSSGAAKTINIDSTGNIANAAAIKNTGSTGTGANINLTSTSGTITGAGAIGDTTNKNASVTFTQSGTSTYSGAINAANFTKAGTGSLTLDSWIATPAVASNVSNAYTVKAGALTLSPGSTYAQLNPSNVNVENASTFAISATGNGWWKGTAFNFTGGSGGGTMNLGGNPIGQNGTTNTISTSGGATNTITGTLNANYANVNINLASASSGTTLANGGIAALAFTQSTTHFGIGSGGGGATTINVNGGGNLLFKDKVNTTNFNIDAGTVQFGDGTAATTQSTPELIATNVNIASGANLIFNRAEAYTNASVITGTGSLIQAGTGVVTLTGNSSAFAGATTVNADKTLAIGTGGSLGAAGSTLNLASATASVAFTNASGISTIGSTISGTGTLSKSGAGTGVLAANNDYTGTTTVSSGTLQIGNGGTTGTLGTGAVIDNASLVFNRSNQMTVANAISGTGSLTQSGTGTTILVADNSYAGTTAVSGGTLQVGNAGTTGTLGAGDVTLSNNSNLSYVLAESTAISNNISGTGNVSASITGASSTLTVSNPINLAGGATSGVVNLAADNNISVAARIDTTNTTSSAVLLNAGKSTNVGTSTGGDITFSGSGTVTVGTGGRGTLMTGSVTGSTGLTTLVGAGSGNFRYNSDETATNYSTVTNPLGSGLYGIYREAPVITATVNPVIKTYDGIAYSGGNGVGAFSGLLNGDSAQLGTITYTGTSQGAKNASTSTYGLSGTASSGLGYAVSLTPGTLTINKANLTQVTATKTYDGLSTVTGGAQMTAIAGVNGETFTASGTAAISDKNVATAGKTLTDLSGLTLTGNTSQALSSNYNLSSNLPAAGANNAVTITAKTVSLAATKTYDGSTSMTSQVTVTTGVTGESLGYTGATANSKDVVSADRISAITLTDNGAALASNYQLPSLSVTSADNTATISKANLTQVTAAKTYDRLSTVTAAQMTVIAGVNGETFTSSAGTATISSPNVATANKTLTDLSGLTLTGVTSQAISSNYNLSSNLPAAGANNAVTITTLSLTPTITASDKTYDQTNAATLTSQSISGVITGDTVSLSPVSTNTFASADVARNTSGNVTSQTVSATGLSLSGTDASNYALTSTTATTSATINPKSVTVAITASDKIYDQTATATVTRTTSDIFSSDVANVTIGSTSNTFASADVARSSGVVTSQTVTSSGLSLTGTKAGNYALTNATATTTATISPKSLTASVTASDKTYDKTNAATITGHTSADIIAGDAVTISSTGAIFASANVARDGSGNVISQNVTASGLTLAGAQAGNYTLSNASASASTTATINPKTVSLTATKTYDGNTALTGSQLVLGDLLSGDSLSFTGATLNDKNVVGAAYVNAVTLVNSGSTLASNYQAPVLTAASTSNTASVTPAALSAGLTGTVSKVYDATTNATLSGSNFNVTGWVSTEGASVTQTAGTYASANVDVNGGSGAVSATLAASQFTANSGTLLSNYTLPTSASGNVGTITPAALIVKVGDTKAFVTQDANTAANTGVSYSGFKELDNASTALVTAPTPTDRTYTGTSTTPTVGNYSTVYGLSFTPTALHGNYTVTVQKGNLEVVAADKLIVTVASQTDIYGNRNASTAGQASNVTAEYCFVAPCNGANLYNIAMVAGSGSQWSGTDNTGTTVSMTTTVATSSNLSGGGYLKAGNYSWGVANLNASAATPYNGYVVNSGTLTVNKLVITPTASNVSKVYDGTTSAAGVTLNTLQAKSGDTVSALAGSGTYTTKSVVSNDTVTFGSLTLSGAEKDNYALAVSSVQGTGSITPANLTVTATAVTKTYDGTTSTTALGSVGALAGSGDSVNSPGSQSYTNKNAGTGKTVQASGVTIKDGSGADMTGNYTITYVDNTTSVINQANLTVTATQVSKTYDGTTTATGAGSVGTLAGAAANETVSSAGTQAFTDKNFGLSNKTVTASGVTIKDSNNADVTGNYNIAYVNNTTSTINKADLTVTAQAVTKVYDGTTTATGNGLVGALAGAAANEIVSNAGSQAFLDKNAGTGNKTVQASGVTIKDASNADVTGNYNVNYVNNTVSTITPAALSANLTGTVSKVYDATTNATLSSGNVNVTGWVSGEGASVTPTTGTYASPHVNANGGAGAVSATLASSQFSANSGTLLSNYTLPTSASGNVGTITAAALTVKVGDTKAFVTQNASTAIDTGVSYTGLQGADTAATALVQVPVAANRTYTGASTPLVGNYSEAYGLSFTPTAQNGNYTVTVQKGNLEVVPANHILITAPSQSVTYGIRTVSTAGQASNVTAQYCFNATDCNGANLYSLAMTSGSGNTWTALDNAGAKVSMETTVTTAGNLSSSGYLKAGNYTYGVTNVTSSPTAQYSGVTINGGTLTVDKLSLTPATTGISKVYDGTTSAAGVPLNLAAIKAGDAVTATAASGTYTTPNVVANDTVTFGGLSLSGVDKDNYALAASTVQTSGAITPRALTLQAISDIKTYDGTTSSTGTVTVSGLAPGATDSVTSLTQAFASKNVLGANGSTLIVNSGYKVNDGNSGNNYAVNVQSASGTITTKSLGLAAVTHTKTYDGTRASTANVVVTGIADNSGDTVTGLSQAFGSKNVLGTDGSLLSVNSGYSVNDGNSGGNYSVSTSTAAGTITPKTLNLAAVTETKVYDGSTTSTGSVAISGIASGSGDTVTGLTQSFASKNVLGTGLSVLSVNNGYSVNDGNSGRNYMVESTTAAGTITPKALTLTAVPDSKIYDGTTSSSGTVAISGLASGSSDFVTAVQSFGSKNVLGTDVSTLSVNSDYSVSDGNSGNNYAVTTQSANGTITPKALTLAAVTDTKTYDGTTRSSVSVSVSGIAANSGDTVTGLSQTFGSKNVLGTNGSTLTVDTGYTVNDGNSGRNYSVGTTGTTGTINKADLTVTATQVTKTYDASVNATGNGTVGSLAGAGDSVNSQGAQAFLDANAGTNKTVRASGVTIKDANSQDMTANYNIIYADNTSSAINKANLTITANADARFVTQTDATGFNGVNYSGLVGGESSAVLTGTLAIARTDANTNVAAGSYPGSLVPSGLASDNYTIRYANGNYTIVPANQLLIRTTNTSTTYGTTPTFSTTAQYLNGTNNVINTLSRSVSGNITTFSDNAGGSVNVNLQAFNGNTPAGLSSSGNTVVGNYLIEDKNPLITGANFLGSPVFVGNWAVNQKAATPSASGLTKVYDGTTGLVNAALSLTGQVTGDKLGVSGSGMFNSKKAGNPVGYAFDNLTLNGDDQGNYFFSGGNSLTGSNGVITPAPLSLTTTNVTKTYDGTLSATGTATVTGGTQLFGNDSISGGSFAFTHKNAGTANKTVTTRGVTVTDDNNGGNYIVSYVDNTTSTIHQAALTVTAAAAQKTYDGTLSATGTGIVGALAGAGDSVANAGNLSFTDKNAGTGKTVTVTGVQIKDGSGADMTGNYAITYANSNAGVINKASASISASSKTVTYNGVTQTQNPAVLSGFVAGDNVQASGLATGRNAGTYNSNVVATGTDVSNYNITYVNAPLVINKLDATITASATSLVYNGQTQSQGAAVLSGFIAGDSVAATGVATGRNAGSYLSSLSATGADVGNYNITYNNASLNISKRPASLSALGQNVIYNGQTQSLNGTQGSGFVAGDALNFGGLPSGRNVGQYTSAMTVSGSDAANYDVTLGSATLTITPKTASVTALPERVTYNGQTQQQSAALLEGFIAGDDIRVSGLASGRNAGVYSSNALATGQDVGNYSITYQQGALTIDKAPLQFVGTSAADKQYDGNTQASVTPGRIMGLVGHESLSMLSLSGQFDTAEPGSNKPVTVVYGLGDGQNGGLAANYDWSPVKVTASIRRETSSHQATPEAPRPVGKYSRLTYLGFGGLTGIGAATGQVYYAARNTDAQQCTPRKLEECICERPQEGALEICYPKGEAKQAAQLP